MDEKVLKQLADDLEVHTRPGKGQYKYVKTRDIIHRLNTVFKGRWSTEVVKTERIGDEVICEVLVTVTDEDLRKFSHSGFGGAKAFAGTEIGNLYKSAKSKAIKDAVKNWGVALFIEEDYTPTAEPHVKQQSPPSGGSTPPTYNAVPAPQSGSPGLNVPPPAQPETTTMGVPVTPPTQPNTEVPFEKPSVPLPGNIPPMASTPPTATPAVVQSNVPADASAVQSFITPVQEIVIKSKMTALGKEFNTLMTEVYNALGKDTSTIPQSIDKIPYQEAMEVVNYLNKR